MGIVIGSLSSAVACCCCGAAASLCCSCFPSVRSSTSARVMYGVMLLVYTSLAAVCLAPGLRTTLSKIPGLCKGSPSVTYFGPHISADLNCDLVVGYGAIYRICFALAAFFFLMSVLMIKVRSSKDPRAVVQNGFWAFKYLAVTGIMIGAFFIPNGGFTNFLLVTGMIGAFLFIIIQLILLIDFAHGWNEKWLAMYEEEQQRGYLICLAGFTVIFYVGSVVGIGLLYTYFTASSGCGLNIFFITINMVACLVISIVSVLPSIQEAMPTSGLLQSSVVTAYVVYMTFCAVKNEPSAGCNPLLQLKNVTIAASGDSPASVTTTAVLSFNWHDIAGIFIFIFMIIYSCIRNSSHTAAGKLALNGSENTALDDIDDDGDAADESGGQRVVDCEREGVAYDYSLFHTMLLLGSLYVMVSLTNWYHPSGSDLTTLSASYAGTWVKMTSSWVCCVLYFWTLIAPVVLSGRQFS